MRNSGPQNKRLLVLTSASGGGHDTHARATAEWCAEIYGTAVEVIIEHALEDSHPIYRCGVDFYNLIQRRMPGFHHVYYNLVELMECLNPGTVSLGRGYYVDLLERTRPSAILSVMDCLNRGYFEVAKSTLGPGVKCATYCTEFTGGYGFSRNWVNRRSDYFFGRSEETAREAIRRGMARERTLAAGHWAPPPFYQPPMSPEEKSAYLRGLDLDPVRFTLLLSTGGSGAHNHHALLRALFPLGNQLQVIALCGRDAPGRAEFEAWAQRESPFPVRTLPFTDEMPQLLQCCSAAVARAGATTAGEALLCSCPLILNGLGLMMPQELPTWRYFEERGIAFAISSASALLPLVRRWLEHPESHAQVRRRIRQVRDDTTPRETLALLLGT